MSQELVNVIQTLGFPIACVCAMGFYVFKQGKEERTERNTRENRLFQIVETQGKSIDNNTKAIEKLTIMFETTFGGE